MSSKHTEGPWGPTRYGNHHWEVQGGGAQLAQVNGRVMAGASVDEGTVYRDLPAEANARLMAAAPVMLDALKAAQWGGTTDLPEGGYGPCCPVCEARPSGDGPEWEHADHFDGCTLAAAIAKAEGETP